MIKTSCKILTVLLCFTGAVNAKNLRGQDKTDVLKMGQASGVNATETERSLLFGIDVCKNKGGLNQGCSVFCPCGSGLNCQPGVHKCYHVPRWEGEPCSAGYGCGGDLTCEAGSQTCRALGNVEDACHATRPCGSGLNCQPGVHKCYHVPRWEGEPCSAGYECGGDLSCEAGTQICQPPGEIGDPCHATRPCGNGLYCQAGPVPMVCVPESIKECLAISAKELTANQPNLIGNFRDIFDGNDSMDSVLAKFCDVAWDFVPMFNSFESDYEACVPDDIKDLVDFPGILSLGVAAGGGFGYGGSVGAGLLLDLSNGELGCYATGCAGLVVGAGASVELSVGINLVKTIDDVPGQSTDVGGDVAVGGIKFGAGISIDHSDPPTVGFSVVPATGGGAELSGSITQCYTKAVKRETDTFGDFEGLEGNSCRADDDGFLGGPWDPEAASESNKYFDIAEARNKEDCQRQCAMKLDCTGFEYNKSDGRCELWKHKIVSMKPTDGYECYRNKDVVPPEIITPVVPDVPSTFSGTFEGMADRGCRVDSGLYLGGPSDPEAQKPSNMYFDLAGAQSRQNCQDQCAQNATCKGFEYHESSKRCELWKHVIGDMKKAGGYECYRKVQ